MISIKKILVPVDFSEASKKAVTYGLTLAGQSNAKVIIAHIVPEAAALAYAFPTETSKIEKEQSDKARHEIHNLALPEYAATLAFQTIVTTGTVEEELLEIVKQERVDLVVMGTHGRRYLGRWFIGSVTEHMLRRVPVPVLTVSHGEAESHAIGLASLKRVLYATDLSESSSAGFKYAIELARGSGAQLIVTHVINCWDRILSEAELPNFEKERIKLIREMRQKIDNLLVQQNLQAMQIETLVIEGKPFEKILEIADNREIDIIVLNLQSKGMLERAFLGSTAERVVRLAPVPVLSVPVAAIG